MQEGVRKVWLELRIGDWDPDDIGLQLKAYQVNIDGSSYGSGTQGRVGLAVDVDCSDDSVCEEAFGSASYCPKGVGPWWPNRCAYGFIDSSRNDFVFFGLDSLLDADPHGGMHFVSIVSSDPADDPEPFPAEGLYAGTLVLYVTPSAQGTFTFGIDPFSTSLVAQNGQWIPFLDLVPALIHIDCNGNGIGDIGVISSPHPKNFGVKIEDDMGGPGARTVKGIILDPTNAGNYSNITGGTDHREPRR